MKDEESGDGDEDADEDADADADEEWVRLHGGAAMAGKRASVNTRLRAGVAESLGRGELTEELWREVEVVARLAVQDKEPAMQRDDIDEVLGRFAEAFAKRWQRLDPDGHPYNYVRRWATRCWIDHHRRQAVHGKVRRALIVDAVERERMCGYRIEMGMVRLSVMESGDGDGRKIAEERRKRRKRAGKEQA